MKRSFKLILSALTALILPALGWAATPTATWTSFKDLPANGKITLGEGCTVQDDGSVILGSKGLQFKYVSGDGMYANLFTSVVMDVTIPETIESEMSLVTIRHTGGGRAEARTTATQLKTVWNNGVRQSANWSPSGRKTITVTYKGANNQGTHVYVDGQQVIADTGMFSSVVYLDTMTIGAHYDGTNYTVPATGMIVHSLKVYASKLSSLEAEACSTIDSLAWRASFNGANTTEGWITAWGGEADASYVDTITGQGYQIKSSHHPHSKNELASMIPSPFSVALYANVADIALNSNKAVLFSIGNKNSSNYVLLVKTATNKLEVYRNNESVVAIEDNDLAIPGSYHLIVFGTDGTTSFLQVDRTKETGEGFSEWVQAFQIGALFGGTPSPYVQGYNMIIDEVRGYNALLDDTELAVLTEAYPERIPTVQATISGATRYFMTIEDAIAAGAGDLTVLRDTTLESSCPNYANTITVNSDATLELNAPVFDGSTETTTANTRTFANSATINVKDGATVNLIQGGGYINITGDGDAKVIGDKFILGLGSVGNKLSANVIVDTDSKLRLRSFSGAQVVTGGDITVSVGGSIITEWANQWSAKAAVTIADGKKLSGGGAIGTDDANTQVTLTLAAGAIIDATAGAITVNGNVTIADGATVKVTLPAEPATGDKILVCSNAAEVVGKLTFADFMLAMTYKLVVADDDKTIEVAQIVCIDGGGVGYTSIKAALDAGATNILVTADTDEDVTLLANMVLTTNGTAIYSGTVTDQYGNVLTDEDGVYIGPKETDYVAQIGEVKYLTLADAIAAAGEGTTVTLQKDVSVSKTITVDQSDEEMRFAGITVDLNGKTITGTASTLFLVDQANLIVQNGTITTSGVAFQVSTKNTAGATGAHTFTDKLIIDFGRAYLSLGDDLTVTSTGDNCILAYNGAKVVSEAKLKTESATWAAIQGTGLIGNPTRIELAGGSVEAVNHAIYHPQEGILTIGTADDAAGVPGNTVDITGSTGIEMRAGTLNVVKANITAKGTYTGPEANGNGSTVNGAAIALSQHTTDLPIIATITSATLTATGTNGKTFVVADTTNAEKVDIVAAIADSTIDLTNAEILIDTLMLATTTTGVRVVTPIVATVGETPYPSLPTAFAAAKESGAAAEITIAEEATIALDAAIEVTTAITLNLNNAFIKMTEKDTVGNGIFWVKKGGDLTINGEGTLVPLAGTFDDDGNFTPSNDYHMAIWADGGDVVINGGTYNNIGAASTDGRTDDHFDLIYAKDKGTITINGGHFLCQTPAWTLNSKDTLPGNIIVQGGTFKEFDPANCATEGEGTDWVAEGYSSLSEEKTYDGQTATFYTVTNASAKIGNTTYNTLAEAYAAAADNAIITLLGHETGTGLKIAKPITIDFNGKTYTVNHAVGSTGTETLGMQITKPTTLKNGTLTCIPCNLSYDKATEEAVAALGYTSKKPVRMLINNYAGVTLINMVLDGSGLAPMKSGVNYVLSNNGGENVIDEDSTITAPTGGHAFDSCGTDTTVTVETGADIGGTVEVSGGTLDNQGGELNVVITGGGTVEGSVTVDTSKSDYLVKIGNTYCDKVVDNSGKGEAAAIAAAELFTGIATVDGTTATVAWQFGISKLERDGKNIVITAKVTRADGETAAGYAADTTVTIVDADGNTIGSTETTTAGIATFTVDIADLVGKQLKVKATKATK